MKAHLKKTLKKGFLLNEEGIVKLHDIVRKRLDATKHKDVSVLYKIYRGDSLVYETGKYSDLIREDNSPRNHIVTVTMRAEGDGFSFSLLFDKEFGATLEIESDDKDLAYLLFSDIKDYISADVLVLRRQFSGSSRYVLPSILIFLSMGMLTAIAISLSYRVSESELNALLQGESLDEKVNALLRHQHNSLSSTAYTFWAFLVSTAAIPLLWMASALFRAAFPTNVFYFGKEKDRYDKVCARRSQFLWVIVGGLIVSLLAGVLIPLLQK